MKKRTKKLAALLVTGCMAASALAGCAAGGKDSSGDTKAQTDGAEVKTEAGAADGTSADSTDGEHMESAAQTDAGQAEGAAADGEVTELDIFINMNWWPVDTFTGIIPEEIQTKTGVKLNITVAADDKQLGLMIASNEIPDLVFADKELDRLSSSQFCYSYDELIQQYAPDFKANDLMANVARSFSQDEHYYTLLNCLSTNEEWAEAPAGAPGQACIYFRVILIPILISRAVRQIFITHVHIIPQKFINCIYTKIEILVILLIHCFRVFLSLFPFI